MNVLVIGSGGREHALVWKLTASPLVDHVYVVPGNSGTGAMENVANIQDIPSNDYSGLVRRSKSLGIGLVVVGPDDVVVDGIDAYFYDSEFFKDIFRVSQLIYQGGIPCFAPSKEAAELEGSKTYAKDFMARYNIPTAAYRTFESYQDAHRYLESMDDGTIVLKVDGLAAGKGVVLPRDREEAATALGEMMLG